MSILLLNIIERTIVFPSYGTYSLKSLDNGCPGAGLLQELKFCKRLAPLERQNFARSAPAEIILEQSKN
jgi:hypothetical protein